LTQYPAKEAIRSGNKTPPITQWLLILTLPAHVLLIIFSIAYFALQGKGLIIIKAKRDAILKMPRMWRKRKTVQGERRVSLGYIWSILDKRVFKARYQ